MLDKFRSFDNRSVKNKRIIYYLIYTIIFIAMVPLVYARFFTNDKSFVWNQDGLFQHFPVLTYYAKILRQSVAGLFSGGRLQLPLWDFSIGAGSDIITTLNYYGVGDPLSLLAVFFPLSKMELGYTFLILLRMYLAGVAFSAYCREMGKGRFATLCGALAYVFCGYALVAGVRHPSFINPMIILPLLLMGIEKIFKGKKPYVFILAVFYAAITGVYFFYMLGVLSGIYVLIRCWSFCEGNKAKSLLKFIGKFVGYVVVGILLSSIVFVPNIIALLGSDRMAAKAIVETFFSRDYYMYAPIHFLSMGERVNWTILGYVSLVAVAVLMMFSYRRKHTQLKIGFIITTIMLCLPYAAYAMNGFSYVANRWIWGYGFLLAFILTTMLPTIIKIDTKRFKVLVGSAVIYISYVVWALLSKGTPKQVRQLSKLALVQYLIVLAVVIAVFIWSQMDKKQESKITPAVRGMVVKCALLATILVNIVAQADWLFAPGKGDYVTEFCAPEEAYARQTEVANLVNSINDTGEFYRYNENAYDAGQLNNSALISQLHSNSLFYSLVDQSYLEYMSEMMCNDITAGGNIKGLDSRAGLNTLAGTKYYITETEKANYAPYGYVEAFKQSRFSVYENENHLPLGYTYQNYIPRAQYEALNPIQKEQAMLQGVVVDKKLASLSEVSPKLTASKRDFTVQCEEGVTFEDGKFIVDKKDLSAVVSFVGLPDSETFIGFKGLNYYTPVGMEMNATKSLIRIKGAVAEIAEGEKLNKKLDLRTPYNSWYVGRHDFMVNMGYTKDAQNQLTIVFPRFGEYTFDEMTVVCQPMEEYAAQVSKLGEETLENVIIGTNKVNGTIDLKESKFLCMSIPYSKGWSIYVNGEKRELLRANTAYMGVELEAGHHEIELRYFTPYLKMSIIGTIVGMMLFAGIVILDKHKRKSGK